MTGIFVGERLGVSVDDMVGKIDGDSVGESDDMVGP